MQIQFCPLGNRMGGNTHSCLEQERQYMFNYQFLFTSLIASSYIEIV